MNTRTESPELIQEAANAGFYTRDSAAYDEQRWRSRGGAFTNRVQQRLVDGLTGDWRDDELIEIGPGTARFTILMARKNNRVTLVDIASGMLDVARKNLDDAGHSAAIKAFVQGSIYGLPFPDGSFDHAISLNVFNHLERVGDAIREMARVTRPGGTILFNYANLSSYYVLAARRINRTGVAVGQSVFSRWITPDAVRRMIADAGLVLERAAGHVHAPRAMEKLNLLPVVRILDGLSRCGPLRPFAPVQFCLCRKPGNAV